VLLIRNSILTSHPDVDSVLLSAGIQRPLDFSSPESLDLDLVSTELTTNYTSNIHFLKYLLPHLLSSSRPASLQALIFVSSGLGPVPMPKVTGYCASKAALHQLILCIREQVGEKGVKVVEIVPPAVKTELHNYAKRSERGGELRMDLEVFTEEVWKRLEEGEENIAVGMAAKAYEVFEERRQGMFRGLMELIKGSEEK
jgi:short-subunit dehydrogenase involved in D-alanine esterification of teichoic acids